MKSTRMDSGALLDGEWTIDGQCIGWAMGNGTHKLIGDYKEVKWG